MLMLPDPTLMLAPRTAAAHLVMLAGMPQIDI
jgi:hypothetical protein